MLRPKLAQIRVRKDVASQTNTRRSVRRCSCAGEPSGERAELKLYKKTQNVASLSLCCTCKHKQNEVLKVIASQAKKRREEAKFLLYK